MTKTFSHSLLTSVDLERVTIDGRRFYKSPSNLYLPSVTTVLSDFYDIDFSEWHNRIGKANADAITQKARSRGTRLHNIFEKYLRNESDYLKGQMPDVLEDFVNTQATLDKYVNEVYGVELRIFSENYGMAGTTDLVCDWGGTKSVIDFKTSRKEKKEEWIESYFVQKTIYALIIKEYYGIDIPQIVTILIVSGMRPKLFIKKVENYKEKVNEVCNFIRTFDAYRITSNSG